MGTKGPSQSTRWARVPQPETRMVERSASPTFLLSVIFGIAVTGRI